MHPIFTILILVTLLTFTICAFMEGWCDHGVGTIGAAATILFVFIMSAAPVGISSFENFDATATKIGKEIVVQSEHCPTILVDKIEFMDKDLYIIKKTPRNGWGIKLDSQYSIKIFWK